jgi:hypothetical protein
MKKIFALLGFGCSVGLVGLDFATTKLGIERMIPLEAQLRLLIPTVIAGTLMAMNGMASYFMTMLIEQKESAFATRYTMLLFFGCLVADALASWIGLITEFAGNHDFFAALETIPRGAFWVATGVSVLVTSGPFMPTLFWSFIQDQGGIFACLTAFLPGGGGPPTGRSK